VSLHFGVEGTSDSVALGQFNDVLCRHGSGNEIGIEFMWSPTARREDAYSFDSAFKKSTKGAAVVSRLRLGQNDKGFTVTRQATGAFKLAVGSKRNPLGSRKEFHPQNSFTFSAATLSKLPPEDAEEIRQVGSVLLDELERIIYLGPVRQLAQRYYPWDGVPPSTLGDDGNRAIDALIASGLLARKGKPGGELFEQTGYWLTQMGLATGLDVKKVGTSSLYELIILAENSRSNIKDVGVGVTQVLPVIVACLHAPTGHTVIVEEPESHLHPLAQSILANLFTKVSRERKVQIIAETHSEHLFRRMQTLIAKETVTSEACALYFIKPVEGRAKLQELQPNEFGVVVDWPDKFFGDAIGEAYAQSMARVTRMTPRQPETESPDDKPTR
jgi:hypothetical protein